MSVSSELTGPFEQRVVAFLDVLGFKALIDDAEKTPHGLSKLNGLQDIIKNHVSFDNDTLAPNIPEAMHPRYLVVSDSIILSAPLSCDGYSGLVVVALKSLQITQKLFEMGFLLRGAISVGPVLHVKDNIFGSGYSSAYLAQERATHPHLFMTDEAKACFKESTHLGERLDDLGLWVNYEKQKIIDVLHPSYLRRIDIHGGLEDVFSQFHAFIHENLRTLPAGSSARSKWEWMAMFYNAALERHDIDTTQRFESFPLPASTQ